MNISVIDVQITVMIVNRLMDVLYAVPAQLRPPPTPPWSELGRVGPGPDSVQGPGPTPLGPEPTHFVKFVY